MAAEVASRWPVALELAMAVAAAAVAVAAAAAAAAEAALTALSRARGVLLMASRKGLPR